MSYRFTIRGEASPLVQAEFEDFNIWVSGGYTMLQVEGLDRAGLYGLIGRIEAMGLEIVQFGPMG